MVLVKGTVKAILIAKFSVWHLSRAAIRILRRISVSAGVSEISWLQKRAQKKLCDKNAVEETSIT